MTLGKNIKLRRVELDMPAKTLAEKVGVSPGYISKIENDEVAPSLDTLRGIVKALETSYHVLLIDDDQASPAEQDGAGDATVVTREDRKRLHVPNRGSVFEILTPDLQGAFEFVRVEQRPGKGGEELFGHQSGHESVLVLEGVLHVYIGETAHILRAGDCLTFDASQPHRYVNEGTEKAVWVYVAAPPSL